MIVFVRFCLIFHYLCPSELSRNRAESQKDNQNQSWSQTGQRPPPATQGEQGGPPPAKKLKSSPASQQQLANSNPRTNPVNSHLSPHRSLLKSSQTQPSNFSCPNAPLSSSSRPQLPSAPFSHLQARIGESEGGNRWTLRQTLGQLSLARRIQGKERLAIHLRQRVLSDRGEETELLTYQDNTEDLQVWRHILMLSCKAAICLVLSLKIKGKSWSNVMHKILGGTLTFSLIDQSL